MSRLLIDGYNLLYSFSSKRTPAEDEVENLLEALRTYKKQKGHAITVVFDGYERGMPIERVERIKGISVVYSRLGEKADQVIVRKSSRWGGSCVVVTSDREVVAGAERSGAVVVGSAEFADRWRMAELLEIKGGVEPLEPEPSRIHTKKKGNPRRRSKKERARLRKLKKL